MSRAHRHPPGGPWTSRGALGLTLALSVLSACDPVTAKRTTEQFVPVKPGTRVEVTTKNGWIKVVQGRPGIVAIKTHRRSSALAKGEAGLKRMQVKVEKSGGVLRVLGSHPEDPHQRRYQLNFVLKVPPGTPLKLRTQRGSLRLLGVVCDADGETQAGEIKARNVQGRLRLSTGKGNIRAVGRIPRFRLDTKLGAVQVILRSDTHLKGNSHARSHNGDVTLTLGPKAASTITAESSTGRVRSDFPARSKRKGWLRAVVAGGGVSISLSSKRGVVRVKKGS